MSDEASQLPIELVPCDEPRAPELAIGLDDTALALARRLLALDDASLAALECAGGDGVLVVRASADRLPWVDGIDYLAALPGAPDLFVPTCRTTSVAPPLASRALRREHAGRVAWLRGRAGEQVLVELTGLQRASRAALAAFCGETGA